MAQFKLDHVAVAVHSIKPALRLFRDTLGGQYLMGGEEGATWRWVQVRYPGGGKIELLEPIGDGFLGRFLERRGEGLHHVTFKTDDLAAAIAEVEAMGYELVDKNLDNPAWKEAFFRPRGAHGVLIQIAQSLYDDDEASKALRPSNLEELLGE